MKVMIDDVQYVPAPPAPTGKTFADALNLRFDSDAGDDLSLRQYLHKLFCLLWDENEGFSGKRPFGNSGWEFDIYKPLAEAEFIDLGQIDASGERSYGRTTAKQFNVAHNYVRDMIAFALFGEQN